MCGGALLTNGINWQAEEFDIGPAHARMFRSYHSDVVNFAFADGSVRGISGNVDRSVLLALGSRSGDEVVSLQE